MVCQPTPRGDSTYGAKVVDTVETTVSSDTSAGVQAPAAAASGGEWELPEARRLGGSEALRLAARPRRAAAPVHRLGPRERDRLGLLLVLRAAPRLRGLPALRPLARPRSLQPAGRGDQGARRGPLLPSLHLRLPAAPVRRAGARVLALVGRRALHDRQHRPRPDRGDGERRRDQHRARARPQARPARALALEGRARPERLRALLHRAQPRAPRARGHARGSRERAARARASGSSFRAPCSAACARPGGSSAPASRAWASGPSRFATTSSAPGR